METQACIFPLIKKNKEASKFKVGDNVRISKYKNIFRKVYVSRLTKLLWLKKLKILCCGHMVLVISTEKKLFELFTKKYYKKQIKNNLELKK